MTSPRLATALSLSLLSVLSAGCGPFINTPMHAAASDVRTAPPGKALLMFVHPSDGSWPIDVVIEDGAGHYVAALGSGERLAVPIEPGHSVYVAFIGGQSKTETASHDHKQCLRMARGIAVEAEAGKVYYVLVSLHLEFAPQGTQQQRQANANRSFGAGGTAAGAAAGAAAMTRSFVGFQFVPMSTKNGQTRSEIAAMLTATEPRRVDRAAAEDLDDRKFYYTVHGHQTALEVAAHYTAEERDKETLDPQDGF